MSAASLRQPRAWVSAVTQGVEPETACLSLIELLAYYARVSNPSNRNNHATAPQLANFLRREAHWSPFQMVSVTIGIETNRAIAHQVLRHASAAFQEFSQRYAAVPVREQVPYIWEARMSGATNRQSSLETEDADLHAEWFDRQMGLWLHAVNEYEWAISKGIALEVARAVLPEGSTPTTMFMAAPLRTWFHYLDQRLDPHTQKEHRLLAASVRAGLVAHCLGLDEVLPIAMAEVAE